MDKQNTKISFNILSLLIVALLLMCVSVIVFLSISVPQTLHAQVGSDYGSGPDPGSQNADGSGAGGSNSGANTGNQGNNSVCADCHNPGSSGPGSGGACVDIATCTWGPNGTCSLQDTNFCPSTPSSPPPAPVISFTASPDHINPNGSSNLVWSVANDVTSCTATGGWSGDKGFPNGNESFSPLINTSYTLNCTGAGGTDTKTVQVRVPTGTLSASYCEIPIEGGSCDSTVTWTSNDFFAPRPSVLQGSVEFSTDPSGSLFRSVKKGDSLFTLKDPSGTFIRTVDPLPQCAPGSVWVVDLSRCSKLPSIDIYADPKLIRSGETTDVKIAVDSNYDLKCALNGGARKDFDHERSVSARQYNYETNPLTSASIVQITCVSESYPVITATNDARISVVGIPDEI